MEPEVSIIVLSYNHWECTERMLCTLGKTSGRAFETVVVDNGSAEETRRSLAEFSSGERASALGMRCVYLERNLGVAGGRNVGTSAASGRYLAFLDNDVEVTNPIWLDALVTAIECDAGIGVAGGALIHVGGVQGHDFWGGFVDAACRVHYYDRQPGQLIETDYCLGACMLVEAGLWRELAGFSTVYGLANYEDVDFCLRAREKGMRCVVVSGAQLLHHSHSTTRIAGFERMRRYLVSGRKFRERWLGRLRPGRNE